MNRLTSYTAGCMKVWMRPRGAWPSPPRSLTEIYLRRSVTPQIRKNLSCLKLKTIELKLQMLSAWIAAYSDTST